MVPSRYDVFEQKRKMRIQRCLMTDLSGEELCDESANDLSVNHRVISLQEVWDDLHKVTHEQMVEATGFLSPEKQYTFIVCP